MALMMIEKTAHTYVATYVGSTNYVNTPCGQPIRHLS